MEDNNDNKQGFSRRDMIKGMAGIPIVGGLALGAFGKHTKDENVRSTILKELDINAATPPPAGSMEGEPLRLGIIGFGIRGKQLGRALGFATKEWTDDMLAAAQKNSRDSRLKDFMEQENLNVQVRGVCDIFEVYADMAAETFTGEAGKPKIYKNYMDLMEADDIDAVVIATPDHWHAPMAIAAARNGKHVYVEKPMTHNVSETYELYDAVKKSGIVLQVGHQHRQTQSFLTAFDAIEKGVLGHISLVQTNTNRNSDNGAWQYKIHEKASPQTIDWKQFIGNAPMVPFNKEHFFRWRKWWAYGTGLSGDLLTHDFDRINYLLRMGIPKSLSASGGIYTHRDGREVPDVFQVVFEYPEFTMATSQEAGKEKGMTFMYSATLGNQWNRGTLLMGHDGTMELGNSLTIHADSNSTKYKDLMEKGVVNPDVPLYSYDPAAKGVDGVTSATAKYFANKGLLFTYRDGRRVDSTHLHIKQWLSAIRHGDKPACGIEEGYEEAISAHMGTLSYKLGKRIEYDHETRKIVGLSEEEMDHILIASDYKPQPPQPVVEPVQVSGS